MSDERIDRDLGSAVRDSEYLWALQGSETLKRMRTAYGVGALLCIVVASGLLIYVIHTLSPVFKEVVAAVAAIITGLLSIVSAALGFVFTRMKELEMAGLQRMRELEKIEWQKNVELQAADRATKQKNYERIIEALAPHIRKQAEGADKFSIAYLHTWVIGSTEVLAAMQKFLDAPASSTLDTVLLAMRRDLTLDTEDSQFDLNSGQGGHFTSRGLFERKETTKTVVEVAEGFQENPVTPPAS